MTGGREILLKPWWHLQSSKKKRERDVKKGAEQDGIDAEI